MSLEMQNENELVMESMVPTGKVVSEKKVSKTLTMNEKRAMYGILSFLVIVNRDGLLDDAKTQELMEHLPIFGTVAEKKLYLSQEMFDMKMIEKDILKPMVLEHNNNKKQEKKEEKKKGKAKVQKEGSSEGLEPKKEVKKRAPKKKVEVVVEEVVEGVDVPLKEEVKKEPKKRAPKKKVEVVEEGVEVLKKEEEVKKEPKKRAPKKKVEDPVEEGVEVLKKEEKKRGRKAKQQIVECNTEENVNAGNSQEDQLAALVNQLTGTVTCVLPVLELQHPDQEQDPEEIDLADLDEVLSNLEEGEIEEEPVRVATPRLPEPEVEEKGKGKAPKTSKK